MELSGVNSDTSLYGIVGHPVRHSLSPLLHNSLFRQSGLNSIYLAWDVAPESLGLAFEAIRALGIRGVNLTIPHKEEALNFVDEVPEDIDRCSGAINTVVNRDKKLYGYNTDGLGFLTALYEDLKFVPEGKEILVLGAGGAARGAVFALAMARAERILLWNRTPERAEGLKEHLQSYFPELEVEVLESVDADQTKNTRLIVNATPCGMEKKSGAKVIADVPLDLTILKNKPAVYDMVYSPGETPFLTSAKRLGLLSANGLGMLAAQAALSFELWTGKKDGVRDSMLEILRKCRS